MPQPYIAENPDDIPPTPSTRGDASRPSESELRRLAVRRVRRKRAFRRHLFVYAVVNSTFWLIWIAGGVLNEWIFPWPIIPTVFWGLFVMGEASDLFWRRPLSEAQVQHEIDRLRRWSSRRPSSLDEVDDRYDWWCGDEDDWWSWPPPSRFFTRTHRNDRT